MVAYILKQVFLVEAAQQDQLLTFQCLTIRTLNHRAETIPTNTEGKAKEQKHIRGTLKTCRYPNRTFVNTSKRSRADREEEMRKYNNIVIPFVMEIYVRN